MFAQMLQNLAGNLTDVLVYAATVIVFIVGLIKCIIPVRNAAHRLRRGVRALETMPPQNGERPLWQDSVFLGKKLQGTWRRFLVNAEQLDARGLACNLDVKRIFPYRFSRRCTKYHLIHSDYRIHRCTDFMGHIRKEITLCLI